jgi:hypothetical protein
MQTNRIKIIGQVPMKSELPRERILSRSKRRLIFLLSPANASRVRGNLLLAGPANFALARRLRDEGASLGEIFSFISGLYFRGKLAYARAYADPPPGVPAIAVITASGGLVSPDKVLKLEELRQIVAGRVDASDLRYRVPLDSDARLLRDSVGMDCDVVLLGSIATPKYVDPLLDVFGEQLMFPSEFVGRGDMSRGSLLLRCVREDIQLAYVPAGEAVRRGARPPKLPQVARRVVEDGRKPGL